MSEFYPEHRGEYTIGQTVAGTIYKKIYKLVEVTPNELTLGEKILFEDKYGQIITFNGEVVQIVTGVEINVDESTRVDTVPYQLNSVYSTAGFPPFQ